MLQRALALILFCMLGHESRRCYQLVAQFDSSNLYNSIVISVNAAGDSRLLHMLYFIWPGHDSTGQSTFCASATMSASEMLEGHVYKQ
jgi:hypothetical protein